MKIKWNGKAPWGFPAIKEGTVDGAAKGEEKRGKELGIDLNVCFMPGAILDLPKEWLIHWHKVPSVKTALLKGTFGGLELVGRHDKLLCELYGTAPYADQAAEGHIEQLQKDNVFLKNRTRTVLPISPEEFLKTHQISR